MLHTIQVHYTAKRQVPALDGLMAAVDDPVTAGLAGNHHHHDMGVGRPLRPASQPQPLPRERLGAYRNSHENRAQSALLDR